MAGQDDQKNVLELGEDLAVAELVRRAGAGAIPPADMADRVRAETHRQWRNAIAHRTSRRLTRRRLAIAASAILAVGVGYMALLEYTPGPLHALASLQQVTGGVVIDGAGRAANAGLGMELYAGERLSTGTVGRAALLLPSGISLRLDHDTRIRMRDSQHLDLDRGALYVDAGPAPHNRRLDVVTRVGTIRHLGTQYMVLSAGERIEVLVREGEVSYSGQQGQATASAGQALAVAAGQDPVHSEVQVHGERWAWADGLAPAFEIDGRSLDEFLVWASRQTGKTLTYSDPETEALGRKTILRGSVEDLSPEQALAVVMATTSLRVRQQDGILLVYSSNEP
jgi:ferric-dicitrate binding protein FerR (iron transport regulator)